MGETPTAWWCTSCNQQCDVIDGNCLRCTSSPKAHLAPILLPNLNLDELVETLIKAGYNARPLFDGADVLIVATHEPHE